MLFIIITLSKMINMIISADKQAKQTFLGVMLIKFATGLAAIWGTCNIYFLSQLKNNGFNVDEKSNSVIILSALIPICFAVLLSNPFARLVGYKNAIRICAFIFASVPHLINFTFTPIAFAIFWVVVPLSCFCLGAMPILNCLWTQFPKDLSKVSGVAVMIFSTGMIFWNLIFLFIVNPDNEKAVIDQNGLPIFSSNISSRIFKGSTIVYFLAGVCNITGSFLVTKRVKVNVINNKQIDQIVLIQNQAIIDIQRAVSKLSHKDQESLIGRTLGECLKDKKFILIFFISAFMPIYLIYLNLNIKLLYMSYINDDHFLSYCSALVTISAVIGAPFWGYVGDSKGFKFTLMTLVIFDTFIKFLGIFCFQKWNLALLFLLLGVNDKGMITIVGPGLIDMFGIEMATQLVPFKGLAVFIGYIIAPVFQMLLFKILFLQKILLIYTFFSMIGVGLCLYLNFKVQYKKFNPQKQYQLKPLAK